MCVRSLRGEWRRGRPGRGQSFLPRSQPDTDRRPQKPCSRRPSGFRERQPLYLTAALQRMRLARSSVTRHRRVIARPMPNPDQSRPRSVGGGILACDVLSLRTHRWNSSVAQRASLTDFRWVHAEPSMRAFEKAPLGRGMNIVVCSEGDALRCLRDTSQCRERTFARYSGSKGVLRVELLARVMVPVRDEGAP
jgi:hypothetical protein